MTTEDLLDVSIMISEESDSSKGPFSAETTTFTHLELATGRNSRFFIVTDSDGYITTINKANRVKSRFRVGTDLVDLTSVSGRLAILQRN